MAKILFIQDLLFEFMGPIYLASYLEKKGHNAEIVVAYEKIDLIRHIRKTQPDIISFSIMSTSHEWAFKIAREIKKSFRIPIIFGGPHPTFFPEMIKYPFVDVICIGEGEEAIAELAENIDKKKPLTKINNLWVKKDGRIYKNPVRPLIENLDSLPFPNRELYYSKYKFLRNITTKRFLASRGCPYNCTYCFNHTLKKIYQGKGNYLRWRSPDNVIQEIKEIKKKYPLKTVRFVDDTFTLNKKWLYELLSKYKKEINLPFTCLARANEVDEELAGRLKEANCIMVTFGIESGNEEIRNKVLCKGLTNSQIINAARLFRKYKIKFGTYNMICLPGETIDDAFETLRLNAKIKTNNSMCSVFQPFPRTKLTEYAIRKGYMDKNFDFDRVGSLFEKTPLRIKNKKEFINLHKLFMIGVWFPWIIPVIKHLIKLPNNKIFDIIYKLSYGIRSFRSYKVDIFTAMQLGYKLRSRLSSQSE